jgi:type II secretory pathway component PulK
MPVRLYSLRHVPEDEVQELRELLDKNHIDFYESEPGNWGISAGALWLRTSDQLDEAKRLINDYQHQRAALARQEYQRLRQENKLPTFSGNLRQRPLHLLLAIAAIVFILYLSLKPFLTIGRQ